MSFLSYSARITLQSSAFSLFTSAKDVTIECMAQGEDKAKAVEDVIEMISLLTDRYQLKEK
jgi:hypothetical protein